MRRVARFAGSPHDALDVFIIRMMQRITSLMRRSSINPNAWAPWRLSNSTDSGVAKSRSYSLHLARTMLYSWRNPRKTSPIEAGIKLMARVPSAYRFQEPVVVHPAVILLVAHDGDASGRQER